MSKRAPNARESKLHQAALASDNKEITVKQAEALVPDPQERQNALNFLLAVGLFKSLADKKGRLTFRAVTKGEVNATKDLTGEEQLVLSHIKTSKSEGIWTKHLKNRTNLHQTIIDRCLKTLVQKRLIKRVPSVQAVEPSTAMTGGPWYTDNELDIEFIDTLIKACHKFIQDVSFPKRRADGILFPISNAPEYPTALQVRNTLRQARLTETDLTVEHVETLLNVLVLDGEIEKIPAFGPSLYSMDAVESDDEDRKPKNKRKREPSDSEIDEGAKRKPKKKSKKRVADSSDEDEESSPRRHKSKSHRKRTKDSSDEEDEDSDSDSETDRKSRKTSKSRKRSSSPAPAPAPAFNFEDFEGAPAFVYRAVKQERLSLGWSQAPCSVCPSFEFCKDSGPVNPRECVYYSDWLATGTVDDMEDG
ncbi:RNA polymerase Rpc34 [Mycena floridula]|nr:RNA polymerase Rpc34 [Mycena floridula]